MTIQDLINECKNKAMLINDNGGLLLAWEKEQGTAFNLYLELVNLFDDTFYMICKRDNLNIDEYYKIVEKTIKSELPDFTY